MNYYLLLLILLILGTKLHCDELEDSSEEIDETKHVGPVVKLHNGHIRGKILKTWSGKEIYSFLGIRYAHPPTGDLRFKAPEEWTGSWTNVKNMYGNGNMCPHLTFPERKFKGDEDCLFLNVYTTKLVNDENPDAGKLGVFLFLHGGGFTFGSGISEEYGPHFLLEHDMILVMPNYRLGPFGFLSMGNDDLPGNLGLLDQQLALKWVKRNIAAFGGDPNSITLGGSQAGAISTHIHALTPSSHGLFARAIALSGDPLTAWGHVSSDEAKKRALRLGELLSCQPGDWNKQKSTELSSSDLISCLSQKEIYSIVWKSQFVLEFNTDYTFPFVPVVGGSKKGVFLQKHPKQLLDDGSFIDIPWIVGVTSLVGLPHALQILVFPQVSRALNENFEYNMPTFLGFHSENKEITKEVGRRIEAFYPFDEHIGSNSLEVLGMVFSDAYYFSTLMETVKAYASKNSSPLYGYHFSYNYRKRKSKVGVPQGDDIAFIFPGDHYILHLKPKDGKRETVKRLTSIVAAFVNTGNPVDETSHKFTWEPLSNESPRFLDIGQNLSKMMDEPGLYTERLLFWEGINDLLTGKVAMEKDEL